MLNNQEIQIEEMQYSFIAKLERAQKRYNDLKHKRRKLHTKKARHLIKERMHG